MEGLNFEGSMVVKARFMVQSVWDRIWYGRGDESRGERKEHTHMGSTIQMATAPMAAAESHASSAKRSSVK